MWVGKVLVKYDLFRGNILCEMIGVGPKEGSDFFILNLEETNFLAPRLLIFNLENLKIALLRSFFIIIHLYSLLHLNIPIS